MPIIRPDPQPGKADHIGGEIDNADRLAHIE